MTQPEKSQPFEDGEFVVQSLDEIEPFRFPLSWLSRRRQRRQELDEAGVIPPEVDLGPAAMIGIELPQGDTDHFYYGPQDERR
ncbi:MAG TPA: hypothetical protein VF996_01905 [Candidatus Saccharimonadales bacterium]|jgi:hypothetical protein